MLLVKEKSMLQVIVNTKIENRRCYGTEMNIEET